MQHTQLGIILPVYNPPQHWHKNVQHALQELSVLLIHVPHKIIIVNDGSTSNITNDVDELMQEFSNLSYHAYTINKGKGGAIREGLKQVDTDFYIYTDWDFPFGVQAVEATFLALQTSDLVIGTRHKNYYKVLPPLRKFISKSLQLSNLFLTRFKVKDTQAGLKGLNRDAKKIFLNTTVNSFLFELEFIQDCIKQKINISFITLFPKPNIVFTNFGTVILWNETKTFFKLLFR